MELRDRHQESAGRQPAVGRRGGLLHDWRNIQQQIYLPTCGYYFTTNVGNAESYGAELEVKLPAAARPDPRRHGQRRACGITRTTTRSTVAVGKG